VSATAIYDVTQALAERLKQALAEANVQNSGDVFVGPLDDPQAQGASLILFLYRISPNPSLRNSEHRVVNGAPPPAVLIYDNSLPLTLHFLITTGTRPVTQQDPLLNVLGFAMRDLNTDPDLTGPGVDHEAVRVSLESVSTDEMSRIWTLFPTANYRTSVAYVATPVWLDPKDPPSGAPRVVDDRFDAGPKLDTVDA
jgi:hypothetical protein